MFRRLLSNVSKNINPITITDNAWKKIMEISYKQKNNKFLFSAKSGGCNGFNYKFNIINDDELEKINTTKIKAQMIEKDNTKIFIDPMSEFLIFGTTLDYIYEDFEKGIYENKFVFIPNKEKTISCGCGISFTPKY